MKKILCVLLTAVMALGVMTGCETKNTLSIGNNDGKIKVVTTIFPEYDWVRNIMGEKADDADITLLLDNGVDLHSYQPTASDIMKITTCDLFIYVGGESDEWVEDALKQKGDKDMVVINLLDVLGNQVKEEEVVEGMQEEEEEEADHKDTREIEYDEHVWLSLKNASVLCETITEKLCEIDGKNAEVYKANNDRYKKKLDDMDNEYKATVDNANKKTLLFGDRFPFRYMTEDYGLDYFAAFVGCSAETEASFETIVFLANKVDELQLSTILTIEGSDGKIAETIKQNTKTKNQEILKLDSIQSITSKDIESGASYLNIMENNLNVIKEALK